MYWSTAVKYGRHASASICNQVGMFTTSPPYVATSGGATTRNGGSSTIPHNTPSRCNGFQNGSVNATSW